MDDRDEELADILRDLTDTLGDLQGALEDERRQPRPPGLFRPPRPEEVLRFGDQVAIPAMIALLEANIRALKAFRRTLKLARTEREARGVATDVTDRTRRRSSEVRETTLTHLDRALTELQSAVSDDTMDVDDGTRELLEDARRLRRDLEDRLSASLDRAETSAEDRETHRIDIDVADGSHESSANEDGSEEASDPIDVDVDAELETLKDQYGSDETADEDTADPASSSDDDTDNEGGDDEDDSNDDE